MPVEEGPVTSVIRLVASEQVFESKLGQEAVDFAEATQAKLAVKVTFVNSVKGMNVNVLGHFEVCNKGDPVAPCNSREQKPIINSNLQIAHRTDKPNMRDKEATSQSVEFPVWTYVPSLEVEIKKEHRQKLHMKS